jgi:glycosyltransferase involved in cell wall biosynthesis
MSSKTEAKKIKIAYIIPRFYPFKGGAERNTEALAERMVKEGYDVTVITTDVRFRSEKLEREEVYKGIKIIRIHAWNKALYAGFYPGLLPFILKNKYDIIHTSGIGFLWREICLILKKLLSRKTKFVVTPHGPFMTLWDKKGFRGFARRFYTRVLRLFLNNLYDAMIEVTPKQKEWMISEYKINENKIFLVPNGIDQSYLSSELVEHKKDEKVIISFTGRMEWYKGAQDVIRALSKLVSASKLENNFEFIIMGRAGNYTAKLKELVEESDLKEKVRFVYSPTDEERDNILLNESQINVLPSKWEATGIVLIEAMAKGNVIISSSGNEGADLLIKEGDNGFIYDFGDTDSLAKILKKLINDYDLRQEMRKMNLTLAKNFSWESIFPKYLELIEKFKIKY